MSAQLIDSELPLVAAPMAGGVSTVGLVKAVASAGAFGFIPAGYLSVEALAERVGDVRAATNNFGVNLFVPSRADVDVDAFVAYARELQPEADVYGLKLGTEPTVDDDHWDEKLAWLQENPVPVVSLTFGLPDPDDIARLRAAGMKVLATVTTLEEARLAAAAAVDGLVVQGYGAGGHSASYDLARDPEPVDLAALVREIRETVGLPVVAAGGVDGPERVRELLAAGAEAVAVGTLLMLSDEAGTSPTLRAAFANPAFSETVITRAFTGRPARSLRNGFIDRHEQTAICAYPSVNNLTRGLRAAAAKAGDADRLHLWAGTGYHQAQSRPAAEIIRELGKGL